MNIKGIVLAAAAAMALNLAVTSDAIAASGTGVVTLKVVGLDGTGNIVFVRISTNNYNYGDNCERQDDGLVLSAAASGQVAFDRMLRNLSAAIVANTQVSMWVSGCAIDGNGWSRPRIHDVSLVRP